MAKAINMSETTGVSSSDVAVLEQAEHTMAAGVKLDSPKVPKKDRKAAIIAAVKVVLALGLGANAKSDKKAHGHGHITRLILKRLLAKAFGKELTAKEDIDPQVVIDLLNREGFAKDGLAELGLYLDERTKADAELAGKGRKVSEDTRVARLKGSNLTKAWFDQAGFKVYSTSLKVITQARVGINWNGNSIKLSRAMGLALGKNVTAAEVANAAQLGV